MKPGISLLATMLSLALAACANDQGADDPAATGAGTAPGTADADTVAAGAETGTPATGAAAAAAGDNTALRIVQEVDRHEIAAAEDALARNVQGEVRSYAGMLRDEHRRNLEATRDLLGGVAGETGDGQHYAESEAIDRAGADVTSPAPSGTMQAPADVAGTSAADAHSGVAAIKDKHDAERQRLAGLEGEEFSRAWVDAMVKGHEEALAKLDNELIPGASDPTVIGHLQSTRAAIARHLETARSLQQSALR